MSDQNVQGQKVCSSSCINIHRKKKSESSVFTARKSVSILQQLLYEFDVKLAARYKPKFQYLSGTSSPQSEE